MRGHAQRIRGPRPGPATAAALRAAVDRSDCGYATLDGIGETFAAFAAARHGWTVDPGRVHLVPDVMAGFDALLALTTEPGDGVVINPPVYPPKTAVGDTRKWPSRPLTTATTETGPATGRAAAA